MSRNVGAKNYVDSWTIISATAATAEETTVILRVGTATHGFTEIPVAGN